MGVVVNKSGIFLKAAVIAVSCRFLKCDYCFRRIQVIFARRTATQFMVSNTVKMRVYRKTKRIKRLVVMEVYIVLNFLKSYSAYAAYCVRKVLVDDFLAYSHCLKNLRRLVGLNCRNTHFCGNFYDAVYNSLVVVVNRRVVVFVQKFLIDKFGYAFVRKIRIYRTRTVAQNHCRLMNVAYFRRLKDN